ncbi:zinc finger, CCHC-type containing protein [Tanacetum coccineum]
MLARPPDKLNYLEQPLPLAPVALEGQQVASEIIAAHNAWIKGSKEIAELMLMTMEPEIHRNIENLHANDMLKDYIDNLERLGHPVTLGLAVSLILIGLRKEFDGFVQNYNMHSLEKTVNELHAMLKLHEQTLPKNNAPALHVIRSGKVQKGNNKHKKQQPQLPARGPNQGKGKNKLDYAPKPKIPPPPKRKDPYLAELLKKKKNAASRAGGSGIFTIELNTFFNRSWIYDTGCGTHICNTTQALRASRKLKLGALSLYVGNGQREVVEAIGIFYLCLPSGLEIVLNNCHYALSITRRVIFVFRLYEDGFINRFMNNTIQVSRNNVIYFSAILRDGIFEIDLSNFFANESSVYTKGIEKLQHDGLLNLTDLKAFEKCVPCMSGKIARKPYTHQVERAKDLLGLIHTDVHKDTTSYNRMCLYIDAEEHELGDLGEPANYKAALLDPESDKWMNAMNVEMQSVKDNKVWDLVVLPYNSKTAGSKWLFKKKTDMDGAVHTYKARLVAKGYTQTPGIDYEETFSLVADIRAIRILIAITAFYDYEIWQMDVKTAFLNGYLSEEVYMEQPEGFVNPKYPNRNSKRESIPIQEKLRLSKSQGASTPAELKRMQNIPYALAIGSIMYAVGCTRLDVLFAQNITSRFQQNPSDLHLTTVKNILKYLMNTKDMFLTKYVFVLNGGAVDWKSAKQSIFATSSAEVEYIAAYDASKEAIWVRKFIFGLGIVPTIKEPISMYCDNTGEITIANESGITKGTRHFRAKVHYLREVIKFGDIKLEKVHTDDNLADPFTKALAFPKHSKHTRNIRMLPANSLM